MNVDCNACISAMRMDAAGRDANVETLKKRIVGNDIGKMFK